MHQNTGVKLCPFTKEKPEKKNNTEDNDFYNSNFTGNEKHSQNNEYDERRNGHSVYVWRERCLPVLGAARAGCGRFAVGEIHQRPRYLIWNSENIWANCTSEVFTANGSEMDEKITFLLTKSPMSVMCVCPKRQDYDEKKVSRCIEQQKAVKIIQISFLVAAHKVNFGGKTDMIIEYDE